jgi:hypothetical protein
MQHQQISAMTLGDAARILESGSHLDAARAVISVALHATNRAGLLDFLALASTKSSPLVRGNALIGFGHMARRFGSLDRAVALPAIASGLRDPDPYVRSHANAAADDFEQFLGWTVVRSNADA